MFTVSMKGTKHTVKTLIAVLEKLVRMGIASKWVEGFEYIVSDARTLVPIWPSPQSFDVCRPFAREPLG